MNAYTAYLVGLIGGGMLSFAIGWYGTKWTQR